MTVYIALWMTVLTLRMLDNCTRFRHKELMAGT